PFALVAVAAASWCRRRSLLRVARDVALLTASWLGLVSLATVRNYLVAGRVLLISDTELPMRSFIIYNLPRTPDAVDRYLGYFDGSGFSAATILSRIMVDHPMEFFRTVATKIGFSLGALQLMGQRFHPELFAPAIAYLVAVAICPAARAVRTWPIHGFVLAHLAGMALSMPSNYGYRMILPMHLFFAMFAVALAERFAVAAAGAARPSESRV
ncbi:MAG TPA: hypothetical protein VKD69_15055, partial [Vicinamibacterales bacterium]|nr:hypothetical protein [Vicinamibacterales bacterium]